MYSRIRLPIVAVLLFVGGCGDDGIFAGADASTPETAAPAAPAGTFHLHVVDYDLYTYGNTPPLANASVAFYPPGGGAPMEVTTAADGVASFSGIDWSQGQGTVVVYAENRSASILMGIDPDALAAIPRDLSTQFDDLVMSLATRASKVAQSTITGKLTKSDANHYVTLGATTGLGSYQAATPTYSLTVPQGKATTLVGTEWQPETAPAIQSFFKWIQVDAPAGTATLDIDFGMATALTSTKVKRTYTIPGGASGALGGTTGYLITTLPLTNAPLGFVTLQQPSSDGDSVAIEAEVIPNFPGSLVTYNILRKADGSATFLIEDGAPADGTTVDGFVSPAAFTFASVHLGDPLPITGLVDMEGCYAGYTDSNNDTVLQISVLRAPVAGAFTLTPPATATLPMALQAQLGSKALTGIIYFEMRADTLPISMLPRHYAYSRPFSSAL